ncbi:hypothetical protein KM043_003532 [Ampulex compressa]|nr:hypothetical protein KM043_003532 [Ampulex compressa]
MLNEASISASFFLSKEEDGIPLNEDNEMKKDLIGRLEKIMLHWLRQIREALAAVFLRKEVQKIQDELEHWNAIYLNLKYLHAQLLDKEVQSIVQILRNVCLPSAEAFQNLIACLQTSLTEATSNLVYLNIISESCKSLNAPEDVETAITEILLLIIFIWAESPFYNTSNNVEILCRALSAQIIQQCIEHIDLDIALKDDPESGIKILEKCISCCQSYKAIFDKLINEIVIHVNPHKKWDIDTGSVFDRIHMFVQRCFDIIDICRALIIFGSCDKVGTFGGPKGTEYETYCRNIQRTFHENLKVIIASRENIFDVTKCDWLEIIHGFRNTVSELENMAKNLIERIFENVRNVDEGIEAIYALQRFEQRESLKQILEEKWIQIWKIFDKEIERCNGATNEVHEYHEIIKYSQDMDKLCIKQYLKAQHDTMIRASDWIGNCVAEEYTLQCYKRVLNVINYKNSF